MIAQERSRAGKRNKRAASASACIMGRSNFRFVNSDVGKGPHPRAQFLLQHPVAYLGPKHLDSSCIQYPYPELGANYHATPTLSTKFVQVNLLRPLGPASSPVGGSGKAPSHDAVAFLVGDDGSLFSLATRAR